MKYNVNQELLRIDNLQAWYKTYAGYAKVINGVDFCVAKGERVGLVGESGCGKTTLMKTVLQIAETEIKEGNIYFDQKNLQDCSKNELLAIRRKRIAMISQEPMAALNPVMTIGEQMCDIIYESGYLGNKVSRKNTTNLAISAINSVMIPDADRIMKSYPHQLSGGMRQRILIAMALLTPRDLIIADEPATALDVTIQDQIYRLLRELTVDKDSSLIMITHSLGVVRELVDRIYVMYAGNIVEVATVGDLFVKPSHPYTKGLLACAPKLSGGGLSEGIYGYVPDYMDPPTGCRFANRCSYAHDRCRVEIPSMYEISGDHNVACFLYDNSNTIPEIFSSQKDQSTATARQTAKKQIEESFDKAVQPIISVKNLQMYFPLSKKRFVRAIDGVDLTINRGEIVGLVGESGSGKSTMAYTIMGLYKQSGGDIYYKENLIKPGKRNAEFMRNVQIVFQDPGSSLNPYKDVRSTLAMPLQVQKIVPRNQIDQRINEILEMIGLPANFIYKMPSAIGGGEKQLISIARALCVNPEFIVLDEPTSALDVSIQAKIINKLLNLYQDQNLTYLLITHDLSLVRNISTKVAIMYLGKFSEIAPTEAFYQNPLHPYTQMLLSAIPVLTKEEEALKPKKIVSVGEIPSPVDIPSGCSFHTRCRYKMDICTIEDPKLREVEPGHFVRCHLMDH